MLIGKTTWVFESKPYIIASSAVGGPMEGQGKISSDFDLLYDNIWLGEKSFEKAEEKMIKDACNIAIKKSGISREDINILISGDLINQIMPSSFAARTLNLPYMGIYGACSTSMQGLSMAALLVNTGFSNYALAATSSHNASSEKQYRYPNEYGAQKPETAQFTVTGAGAALVAKSGSGPRITSATIGQIIDMGLNDPYNMGQAMAPAAVSTITTHFKDLGINESYYDVIVTGDLGKVGHQTANEILTEHKIVIPKEKFLDCGMLIYNDNQPVFSGGSGCGCAAVTTYGYLLNKMKKGEIKKMLVVATGALISPLSYQQDETIPGIAHAVSIEY